MCITHRESKLFSLSACQHALENAKKYRYLCDFSDLNRISIGMAKPAFPTHDTLHLKQNSNFKYPASFKLDIANSFFTVKLVFYSYD